ncbi:LytR/AlgR family response regulator transcription factor [Lysobacter sp. P5_B9]
MIRILLADDEPIALDRLELAVAGIPDAELVAKARNGKEALTLIRELKPDIAVLDIQMPVKDGFAAIAELKPGEHLPEIIFVTAYQEHAVRAFEVHAVDYLLKPVSFERFREAVRLARARLEARAAEVRFDELQHLIASLQAAGNPENASSFEREFWVRTRDGIVRVPVETIDAITAEGDYVLLHAGGRSHLLKDTISSLATRLDPAVHLRVHRSTIVNLKQVTSLHRRGPKGMSLTLASGADHAIGPNYVETVLKVVNARRWR